MNRKACVFLILIAGFIATGFAEDALSISPSGDIGVGTTAPSEKLDVHGNIRASGRMMDATGFVMPVGTIVPYGGTTAPDGWMMCDGNEVSRTTFADLFAVIATAFGEGDGSTTFNLPDLRGQFLRGVSHGTGVDPDATLREPLKAGGNTGDAVGSKQEHAQQNITGTVNFVGGGWESIESASGAFEASRPFNGAATGISGYPNYKELNIDASRQVNTSTETRAKNVYVNFIIKI